MFPRLARIGGIFRKVPLIAGTIETIHFLEVARIVVYDAHLP